MHKKYRLTISKQEIEKFHNLPVKHTPIVKERTPDEVVGVLDTDNANWIMDTWFPKYNADIFLSHSHDDYNLASKLADQFEGVGLRVFIDSEVWGYANELLQRVDNEYCVKRLGKDGSKIYSYGRRNQTTAQINIILAHALMRMIDLTECFIFLETANSATNASRSKIETMSPWLFHELNVARVIEPRQKVRRRQFAEGSAMEKLSESVTRFKYTADTRKMTNLSYAKLKNLFSDSRSRHRRGDDSRYGLKFLDVLYETFV